ncbi:hypothetical protein D3C81_1376980 [compost metagenome]
MTGDTDGIPDDVFFQTRGRGRLASRAGGGVILGRLAEFYSAELKRLAFEQCLGGCGQLLEGRETVGTYVCVMGAVLCSRPNCLQLAFIKCGAGDMPRLQLKLAFRGLQYAVILVAMN